MASTHGDTPAAIITGAGSGIGRATALMLAREGWRLALVGRTRDTLAETGRLVGGAEGERWITVLADVGDPGDAEQLVRDAHARLGRVDALINNAGLGGLAPLLEVEPQRVERLFRVNAIGPILSLLAAARVMSEQGGGVIVNVSSMATADPFPGLGVYAAAKAGVETICLGVRNELGDRGVRAYAVAPGATETGMLREIADEAHLPRDKTLDPETVASVIADCVLGRTAHASGETIRVPSP